MRKNRLAGIGVLLLILVCFNSCNKKKAEAVKAQAAYFLHSSNIAIDRIQYIILKNSGIEAENSDDQYVRILSDLKTIAGSNTNEINTAEVLEEMINGGMPSRSSNNIINSMDSIRLYYARLNEMYKSLTEGSFIGRNQVKNSELLVKKLTVQMLNLAIKMNNDLPVKFLKERVTLHEQIQRAAHITDKELKEKYLVDIAHNIINLGEAEHKSRFEAISQCMIAAKQGQILAELVRNYDRVSVSEAISSIKSSLDFASDISGNKRWNSLGGSISSMQEKLREDPYWKVLLNVQL